MASPFTGLAGTIHNAFKNIFFDAVLTREVVPDSPAYDPADPPAAVAVPYSCKGLRDQYSSYEKNNNSKILEGDSKILILANSLSVTPRIDDIITVQGGRFTVINFNIDPANAVWVIQGRA